MRQSEGPLEDAQFSGPWITILAELDRRNSISFTTYLFCRRVAACRGHWEGTPSKWYYCNARTPTRTAPASHGRPRHAPAGKRVSTGLGPRHSRFHCEQEASDVAMRSRTCPTSNNNSLRRFETTDHVGRNDNYPRFITSRWNRCDSINGIRKTIDLLLLA